MQRELIAKPLDRRRQAQRHTAPDRAAALPLKHDADRRTFHHLQHFKAGLLEEVSRAAVDLHAAADLVDQAQFFVGGRKLFGDAGQFVLEEESRS